MIALDREIESNKCDLALRVDFNLFDAFKLFDIYSKGSINSSELEEGLNTLGIYPSSKELYLLLRRFDKDFDGLLR